MAQILLPKVTGAAQSRTVEVTSERSTFVATGTYADGEDATLQIYDGTAWVNVIVEGTTQVLDEQNTVLTVYGRGKYRFNKDATVAAAGVAEV